MSVLAKIVKSIFGTKSEKDLKLINPIIDEINKYYEPLSSLSDKELKEKFIKVKEGLHELIQSNKSEYINQNKDETEIDDLLYKDETDYLNDNMVNVFAIRCKP